jgi:hypothetical protein
MMDIQFRGRSVATIQFRADGQISASRGFDVVTLPVPFRIVLEAEPEGSTWTGDRIDAELFAIGPSGAERKLATGQRYSPLESRTSRYDPEISIDFQCTPTALAEYERMRNGEPVDLRMKVTIPIHELESGTDHRKMLCQTLNVWAQDDFRVDTTRWIKALRAVGLAASVLVEIPFPLESDPKDDGLIALCDALASFENGGSTAWKAVVGNIRPYLEEWRKVEPRPQSEPKDGSTDDRKWKLLNFRDALYKCCHFWVHESASETSRDDALLALSSFAALLKALRS